MRRLTNERFLYVLLSILIAAVAWLYVATAQNPPVERTMTVDLQVRGLSAKEVTVQAHPAKVRVTLRGPRSALALLSPSDVDASADLRGLPPGEHRVSIHVAAPPDVRTVQLMPPAALVVLDTLAMERMPVEVRLNGTPGEGVTLGASHVVPDHVVVGGASKQVEEVRHALVTLDVTTLRQQMVTSVPVRIVDANGKEVRGPSVDPPNVVATLPVREGVITKIVPIVPTVVGAPQAGLAVTGITINPATVTLTGSGTALHNVETVATAPMDLNGARGDITRRVAIVLPGGVSANGPRATVIVHIGRAMLSTIFRAIPVRVVGVPAGTIARVSPQQVEVQIEGPQEVLRRLSSSAVTVEVEAAGQKPGQHRLAVRAVLPAGVRLLAIRPANVILILLPS